MTDGTRGKSNDRLRTRLDQMLAMMPIGETIRIDRLAQGFQNDNKRLCMTPRRVSCLVRERDDLKWIDKGLWQKVGR
jgi:hypothetical protein